MRAQVGDRLVVESSRADTRRRTGVVTGVRGTQGEPPYQVRWLDADSGSESALVFPGPDAHIEHTGTETERSRFHADDEALGGRRRRRERASTKAPGPGPKWDCSPTTEPRCAGTGWPGSTHKTWTCPRSERNLRSRALFRTCPGNCARLRPRTSTTTRAFPGAPPERHGQ